MNVTKTTETQYYPVFQKILEDIPGGVTVKVANVPADIFTLGAGTLLQQSSSTAGLFHPVKRTKATGTQVAAASITVKGPSLFKVGEFIGKESGKTASTITSVTRTAAGTDTIVTGTAIGALATATRICQYSNDSTGTIALVPTHSPDSLMKNTIDVRDKVLGTLWNATAGAVVRGTVNESLLPNHAFLTAADKTALTSRLRWA